MESFSTSPLSVRMPQWPWLVYSHIQTSAQSRRSGTSAFMALMELGTSPSGLKASVPSSSFSSSLGTPNRITPGIPRPWISPASFTISSTDIWNTPGMDETGFFTPSPGTTKRGSMRSSTEREVSRTIRRQFSFFRSRRGRWEGNAMMKLPFGLISFRVSSISSI